MRVDNVIGRVPFDRGRQGKCFKDSDAKHGRTDKVEVSRSAKEQIMNNAHKLANMRKNIENGVYAKPSISKAMTDKPIYTNVPDEKRHTEEIESKYFEVYDDLPDVRYDRIEKAKRRISSGEYSDSKVVETIADRVMEQFGFRQTNKIIGEQD